MLVLGVLVALVYFPGVDGPFLFDDAPNIIQPIQAWLRGDTGWHEIVFGNDSGLLHRPLSNLSFALNARIGGLVPLPFKVVNVGIHILCGVSVFVLLQRLLRRDVLLGRHSAAAAICVAAVWLLHPMHVSTVLYVVQRMAQLSALFTLLALIAFVYSRDALEGGLARQGALGLLLLVPALTVFAVLSKENGALVPLLCLVIEVVYYRRAEIGRAHV